MAMKAKTTMGGKSALKKGASAVKKGTSMSAKKTNKSSAMKKANKKRVIMKKRAMKKKSKIADGRLAYSQVFNGTKEKTKWGLRKSDLMLNKAGKVVPKKKSESCKKSAQCQKILAWGQSVSKARKQLYVKGFKAIKKGGALYKATKAIYQMKK